MIPVNKVRDLISKHESLEKELSSGTVDKKKFAEKSKEYSDLNDICLLYTSPSPRDGLLSRMPSSA